MILFYEMNEMMPIGRLSIKQHSKTMQLWSSHSIGQTLLGPEFLCVLRGTIAEFFMYQGSGLAQCAEDSARFRNLTPSATHPMRHFLRVSAIKCTKTSAILWCAQIGRWCRGCKFMPVILLGGVQWLGQPACSALTGGYKPTCSTVITLLAQLLNFGP